MADHTPGRARGCGGPGSSSIHPRAFIRADCCGDVPVQPSALVVWRVSLRCGVRWRLVHAAGLAVLVAAGAPGAWAQAVHGPVVFKGGPPLGWVPFTKAVDAFAGRDSVVGAAVLLLRGGQVVAHHEYGDADRAVHQAVNTRTLFHYGSITKTLTAIAIMQLRDRGRLRLDDRVVTYVPELRLVHDPYGSIDTLTIAMLLSHAGGFQNPTWPYTEGKPWEPFEPTTWAQLVAMMPYQELRFAPGSRYGYSNPGFLYLARIIESITGDPWEVYVDKNIFKPLGLEHSYFGVTPYFMAADRANSYAEERDSSGRVSVRALGREFDPGITIPNGGWNAPLTDLGRYSAFLTGAPATGDVRDTTLRRIYDTVLSRASLAEMWRPRYPTAADPETASAPGETVGLSFFQVPHGGTTFVGHMGFQAGFRAFLYINPESGGAVIAAVNTRNDADPAGSQAAWLAVRDAALDLIK
jgi:CubicO group peptidase (beta-lactamase class C family)